MAEKWILIISFGKLLECSGEDFVNIREANFEDIKVFQYMSTIKKKGE